MLKGKDFLISGTQREMHLGVLNPLQLYLGRGREGRGAESSGQQKAPVRTEADRGRGQRLAVDT